MASSLISLSISLVSICPMVMVCHCDVNVPVQFLSLVAELTDLLKVAKEKKDILHDLTSKHFRPTLQPV